MFRADGTCQMDINFEGTALGVYVVEPTYFSVQKQGDAITDVQEKPVVLPRSNARFSGVAFFGLDTTTFPDGIVPPVRYGNIAHDRAIDTKNAFMHSDDAEHNRLYDPEANTDLGVSKYALHYPMPLENSDHSCERCELSSADPKRSVGPFKIGIVTVPGNTELFIPGDEETDRFLCPAPGDPATILYGTPLARHFGAD